MAKTDPETGIALSRTKPPPASPRYCSADLFAAGHEIRIEHNGAVYTLRITRSGGLILHK